MDIVSLLGSQGQLQTSFHRGRVGWMLTSDCGLGVLRQRLGKWTHRINVVHAVGGRYFAEPNSRYFLRSLPSKVPLEWRTQAFLASPCRVDRLRRLAPFLRMARFEKRDSRCSLPCRRLALRLDSLASAPNQDKIWQRIAQEFDKLWIDVPLFSMRFNSIEFRILGLLCDTTDEFEGVGSAEMWKVNTEHQS